MPWKVVKRGGGSKPYKIVRKDTGKVVGSSSSREKARSSVRARYGSEHGWKPTGKRRKR